MKYEYIEKRLADFYDPESPESQHGRMFRSMSEDGWEFCGLAPGMPHRISEHSTPDIYFFKKERRSTVLGT